MSMNGIDISAYQAGIDITATDAQFVIIKITEGANSYINPYWRQWATVCQNTGKLFGFYHYANGGDPEAEAEAFAAKVNDFKGHCVAALDWESGSNSSFDNTTEWCTRFYARFTALTNIPLGWYGAYWKMDEAPGFDWYWIAQYADYDITGWQEHPWNEGAYSCDIRQYSSKGRIQGYSDDLDLDLAYFNAARWLELCGTEYEVIQKQKTWIQDPRIDKLNEIMYEFCVTLDAYYGQGNNDFPLPRYNFVYHGSFDCSSAMVEALNRAGFNTGNASWTGNLSDELCARGWTRVDADGNPQKGDILLNDANHVGYWDGEHVLEHGGSCPDGYSGCNDYYDYPWNCYLRFPWIEVEEEGITVDELKKWDAAENVMRQLYIGLLQREADTAGLIQHKGALWEDGSVINRANAFISSDEWQNANHTGEERIKEFYIAFLGREASDEEAAWWVEESKMDLYWAAEQICGSDEAKTYRQNMGWTWD